MDGWTLFIAAHAVGASLALVLGAVLLRRRPKGSRTHVRLGRVWMVLMYWVVLSSFGITRLSQGHLSWIHGLSVFTFYSLTKAIWAARTGRVRTHRHAAVGSYLGLVGAFLGAIAVPSRLVPRLVLQHPGLAMLAVAGVCLVAALLVEGSQTSRTPVTARPASPASGLRRRREPRRH